MQLILICTPEREVYSKIELRRKVTSPLFISTSEIKKVDGKEKTKALNITKKRLHLSFLSDI